METTELLDIIARGEDSKHRFMENIHTEDSLAEEMVAFSNSGGGKLIVGVSEKDWSVRGLSQADVTRINYIIGNAGNPPIHPRTEIIMHPEGLVMIITVAEGISKPYMDRNGSIWVKCGSDKRKVTSREMIQEMFRSSHGDEIPANGLLVSDIDVPYFEQFYSKTYGESLEEQGKPLSVLLENMNLAKSGNLNISGALLFGNGLYPRLPRCIIRAVAYPGNEIDEEASLASRDITGKMTEMLEQAISFILIHTQHEQGGQGINSSGKPGIPRVVLEEIVRNALLHRDYFILEPIKIFVFRNRVEIRSPGHLPNTLTVENIKAGNSNKRNPILASFASKLLPYRGQGNGIMRALEAYPDIEFSNDKDGNKFVATIWRK